MSLILAAKTDFSSELLFFREFCIPFGLDRYKNLTFHTPDKLDGQFLCNGNQWLLQQSTQPDTSSSPVNVNIAPGNIVRGSRYQLKILTNSVQYELCEIKTKSNIDPFVSEFIWSDFCLEAHIGGLRKIYTIPDQKWLTVWYKNCDILIPNLTTKLLPFRIKITKSVCFIKDNQEKLFLNSTALNASTARLLKSTNQLFIPSGNINLIIKHSKIT